MSMADVVIKDWGNSLGVILPKEIVKYDGLKSGDRIKIEVIKKRIDGFGMFKDISKFTREHDDRL